MGSINKRYLDLLTNDLNDADFLLMEKQASVHSSFQYTINFNRAQLIIRLAPLRVFECATNS